jgi:peptidyl-prolyl cis-trans isomerase SurA
VIPFIPWKYREFSMPVPSILTHRPSAVVRLLAAVLLVLPLHANSQVLDRIVAVVNDGTVLQSEFDNALVEARQQLRGRGIANAPEAQLREQVLERLILIRIQTQRAKEAGIRVDDRELNDVLSNLAAQNNMSLPQFAAAIRSEGGDYLAVREQIRDEVMIQRLRSREVESRINITDQDVRLYLEQEADLGNVEVRLSHILVSVPDGASPEVRQQSAARAAALRESIADGGNFAELAVANSDGQQALDGGDLGWRRIAELPGLFSGAVRNLDVGATTPVIETAGGFHILQLADRRGGVEQQLVTETRARHILLTPNELRDEDATRLAIRDLHDRMERGENFEALARRHSDDPGSKNAGGDLGWQPPGVFAEEFQNQLNQLEPGQRSTPFRTGFGWHIAEVIDRRERDATQQALRGRARQAIANRRMQEEYELWLRQLRDEAYVEYRLRRAGTTS